MHDVQENTCKVVTEGRIVQSGSMCSIIHGGARALVCGIMLLIISKDETSVHRKHQDESSMQIEEEMYIVSVCVERRTNEWSERRRAKVGNVCSGADMYPGPDGPLLSQLE
jgi:hypothetical protein